MPLFGFNQTGREGGVGRRRINDDSPEEATRQPSMQKRIEQLIEEGVAADQAAIIAAAEIKYAKELIAQGFRADAGTLKKAQDQTKHARLVKEKRTAGLDMTQAESCAKSQVEHDNQLRQRGLQSINAQERADAQAGKQRDAEVADAMLADIKAS